MVQTAGRDSLPRGRPSPQRRARAWAPWPGAGSPSRRPRSPRSVSAADLPHRRRHALLRARSCLPADSPRPRQTPSAQLL